MRGNYSFCKHSTEKYWIIRKMEQCGEEVKLEDMGANFEKTEMEH